MKNIIFHETDKWQEQTSNIFVHGNQRENSDMQYYYKYNKKVS